MLNILPTILGGLIKLGDKLIEDKDKKAEFAFEVQRMSNDLAIKLLETKTYPWVDALVKLGYASGAIVKGLIRPLGSLALAGFAVYCEMNGIQLSETVQVMLYGAPVGWGVSRHIEKQQKIKQKPVDEYEDWGD